MPSHENDPLLAALAKSIRDRRKQRALTIKELASVASLSERFLVSVEAGKANISVVKLAAIARALDSTASELLVGAQLHPSPHRGAIVSLLGLRGAGKTAIGRRVAARLEVPFVELDAQVTKEAGMSLQSIFALQGAEYYRKLEGQQLDQLIEDGFTGVIATGGGIVTNRTAYERLKRQTTTVFLQATAADHWNRVIAQGDARPMANRQDALEELRVLLRARRALYEQANHTVDTSNLGLERSVDAVVRLSRQTLQGVRTVTDSTAG